MGLFNKKELEEIARLRREIEEISNENNRLKNKVIELNNYNLELSSYKYKYIKNKDLDDVISKIEKGKEKIERMNKAIKDKRDVLDSINTEMKNTEEGYKKLLEDSENIMYIVESGTYNFHYHYEDSERYEERLKEIKEEQKEMVKCELAVEHFTKWHINGSYKKGEIQMKNTDKLLLRAFNNECDNIIMNVKYSTIANCESKIRKSYEQLNKFVKSHECSITEEYLNLKLEELKLRCDYIRIKQMEREEQQRIREQMKEEERVRKELEAEEKKVEKEEQHFMNELNKLQKRMAKENEENQAKLLKQIEELQSKLSEISEVKADLMNRRMNNKAGYVYIISNKGSLGENVYKIGTTRRLDPQVRVDELSNASVPFKYDVHAMIFTDDAFELENNLHKIFDDKRVNKVNKHKEFFNVTIDEIEKAVKENFNETVEFNKTILNEEYLLSISLEK